MYQIKIQNKIIFDIKKDELLKCLVPSRIDTEKQVLLKESYQHLNINSKNKIHSLSCSY